MRYALPVVPFLFVWASQVGRLFESPRENVSSKSLSVTRFAVGSCLVWLVGITTLNNPNHLSYFNEIAGGSSGGHRWLCDSNVDWGQDVLLLESWLDKNSSEAEPLYLAYFGSFDPASLGLKYSLPPQNSRSSSKRLQSDQLPRGLYVVSRNLEVGHPIPIPDGSGDLDFDFYGADAFAYFRDMEPIDTIGQSMNVYRVDGKAKPATWKPTAVAVKR